MRCHCKNCAGTGKVECTECDGRGYEEVRFETVKLVPTMKHYDELLELRCDALRVTRQATKLKELNPSRADTYQAQLEATLATINQQGEKLLNAK